MGVGGILLYWLAHQEMIGTHSDVLWRGVILWDVPLQEIDVTLGDRSKMASTIQVFRLIKLGTAS